MLTATKGMQIVFEPDKAVRDKQIDQLSGDDAKVLAKLLADAVAAGIRKEE